MGKPIENPIERDVLDELYTTQKLSAAKIAAIYKVKPQQEKHLQSDGQFSFVSPKNPK